MERLVDELARELGREPIEIRRANLIEAGDQPHETASGMRYDSGDHRQVFERAVELIGADRLERERGGNGARRVGLGFASFVMPNGLAPSKVLGMNGSDLAAFSTVRLTMHPDAKVTVFSGACSQGQGTETMLAQVVADRLGLSPTSDISVVLGDTEMTPFDPAGSISSRITGIVGGAARQAADELRAKIVVLAAHRLEASAADIELRDGRAVVRGSRRIGVPLAELAGGAHSGHDLPEGVEPSLNSIATHEPTGTMFSFGTHAVVVEVDCEDTGDIAIRDYVAVHDSGTIVNPLLAEGQLRGAVAQGLGGALLEHLPYGANGEPLTTSYMDYLMPTARELPRVRLSLEESPAPHIPGGMKGVGEAGIVGPAPAIANAIADALGCPVNELPLTPERILELSTKEER
jgi:carbon-monoxide dehydrogenase large subunit